MKLSKVLSIVAIVMMLLVILSNFAYAINPASISIVTNGSGTEQVTTIGGKIIGVIQVVGSVVAVAILVVLGIKYMMGSTEEKAEYKKTLIPYLVGAILIFAASNIAGMVFNAAKGI